MGTPQGNTKVSMKFTLFNPSQRAMVCGGITCLSSTSAYLLSLPIDHVSLMTNNLDRLEMLYRHLGFHIAPRQSLQTSTHVD
jgi:hypothetical protein